MKRHETRPTSRLSIRAALVVFAIVTAASTAVGAERVIAIGDVHGSFDGLTTILRTAGLIDDSNAWVGGDATLVQLGDLLDRGIQLREVMDLLMRLQVEAPASGGEVIVLLGNHETMNLLGIRRDVNREAYGSFVDDKSEARRKDALKSFEKYLNTRGRELGRESKMSNEVREQWLAMHPPGYFEYGDALSAQGKYGAWLRSLPAAVMVDDTLFIHGGYGPMLDGLTVDEINQRVAAELRSFDDYHDGMVDSGLIMPWFSAPEMAGQVMQEAEALEAAQGEHDVWHHRRLARLERAKGILHWTKWYITNPDGPLWFRGAAKWDEIERGDEMAALLDGLGVRRMVVGHSVQDDNRITSRFGERVYLIDTGMLESVYAGTPSALEIVNGTVTAIYPGERQLLSDGIQLPVAPAPPDAPEIPATID